MTAALAFVAVSCAAPPGWSHGPNRSGARPPRGCSTRRWWSSRRPRRSSSRTSAGDNDPVTVAPVLTGSKDAGAHCSYSRCSSSGSTATRSSGSSRDAPGHNRDAGTCGRAEARGTATRWDPLGSASSDNGRADRAQRPAVRPDDAEPAQGTRRSQTRSDGEPAATAGRDGMLGQDRGRRRGGPDPVRSARGTVGSGTQAPGAPAVPGGCACRQDQGGRRSAR